jgi:general secretion pathway protein E
MDSAAAVGVGSAGSDAASGVIAAEPSSVSGAGYHLSAAPLPAFLTSIPHAFSRLHLLLVVEQADGAILLHGAHSDPFARLNLQVHLGRSLPVHQVDDATLAERIDAVYEAHAQGASRPEVAATQAGVATGEDFARLLADAERDLLATDGKAPVVRLLDHLLFRAVQRGASDLHLQPVGDGLIVRHRIDGVLGEGERLPANLLGPIAARIKVIGRMDVSESLVPQDGRTSVTIGDRSIDIRISTMPTPHGERLVLRLLDSTKQLHDFSSLGMPAAIAHAYLGIARRASGIVLVTGPTGSGKTTTIYATLRELDAHERNIMTIEDPIEYELDSLGLPISQSQVNAKKGVTFASGLRHILRQDPDIVLVGEIRDAETARIAIQSSLTGHLVFSTLHTNDAVSAVTRLFDLGVEPYLVASSISAVMAQRLVRVHCTACRGVGCNACQGSGFKGRRGIFELLVVDEPVRRLIQASASLEALQQAAQAAGMVPLIDTARRMVADGVTTQAEIDRVVHG